jgi:hypothetical protein
MSWGALLPKASRPTANTVRNTCIEHGKKRNHKFIIVGGLCLGFALICFSICLLIYGGGLHSDSSISSSQQEKEQEVIQFPLQQKLRPNNWPHPTPEEATQIGLEELDALMAFSKQASSIKQQLEPILDYTHTLPPQYLRKSQAYSGNNPRLRRVVRDLLSGEHQVKIGVIGGSISYGHGTSDALQKNWFTRVSRQQQLAVCNLLLAVCRRAWQSGPRCMAAAGAHMLAAGARAREPQAEATTRAVALHVLCCCGCTPAQPHHRSQCGA